MKDMRSFFHDSDISRRGVSALAVLYGVDEAVSEFAQGSQKILLDEVDHAVICKNKIRFIINHEMCEIHCACTSFTLILFLYIFRRTNGI